MQNKKPVISKVLNVLVFAFLYLPIAVLIVFSFNDSVIVSLFLFVVS